ncbi:MAG: hypothetical protein HOC23_06655 [Halieaceae bacterium]|nr:hypothetical protein [Halieaceae bacterium]
MNDNYYQKFPPHGFPKNNDLKVIFTSGERVDYEGYINAHPQRKVQIDRARGFLDAFEADRERRQRALRGILKHRHRNNTVLAMTLNRGFAELLLNWVESCDRHNIEVRSWTVIAALDENTAQMFEQLGFAVYYPGPAYGLQIDRAVDCYGDGNFRDMMFAKNAVVKDLLDIGFNVLFQDVDLVWLKDPWDFLEAPDRGMLDAQFMYDGPNPNYAPLHANSGFFFLRNTPQCRNFWQQVFDNFDKVYVYGGQQQAVNQLLVHHYFRGLKLDLLGEAEFANGHLFTLDDVSRLPPDPYVIHCSWTSNLEHKLKKYRLAKLWFL